MRGFFVALLAGLALACANPAPARVFTVDDLLRQGSLGEVALAPGGRWLVLEQRDPYVEGARFDLDQANAFAASRLMVADLSHPAAARPLLGAAVGPGQRLVAFSPSGARLAIERLEGERLRLGVVTLASGAVRWFEVTPEVARRGRSLQWLSDDDLLVIARPDHRLSPRLRLGRLSADELPPRWAAAAQGRLARTALGSGAYRGVRARPTPRRLLRIDVRTGVETPLAEGELLDLELSPDHRWVALRAAGEDLQARPGQPIQGDWGIGWQAEHASILDLATGRSRAVSPALDVLPALLKWSPDSRALMIYARAADTPWSAGALRLVDPRSGVARPVAAGLRPIVEGRPELVGAAWMGDDPIVLARPADRHDGRADWYRLARTGPMNLTAGLPSAPPRLTSLTARAATAVISGQGWRIEADGHAEPLVSGIVEAPRPRAGRDGRLFGALQASGWVLEPAAGRRRLRLISPTGLGDGYDLADGERLLGSGGRAVVTLATDQHGAVRVLYRGPRQPPVTVATINGWLDGIDPVEVRAVHHTGPDGQPLLSWLYLPPRRAGAPPPLVIRPYLGDVYRTAPQPLPPVMGFVVDVRVLVGHGYAVLTPSLPVATASGSEPTADAARRILEIVDAAAQAPLTAGTFDPGRLALWGHSYGGYTVMAALTQSDRFRAAISQSGYSDVISQWAHLSVPQRALQDEGVHSNTATGSIEAAQGRMGGPPWADLARYTRNSPLLAADRIHIPLMLVHGDQDGVVDLIQSEAMFSALYRQDKDAILLTYWGEGHFINSPANVRDLYAQAFAFLDAHLGGASDAGVALAPSPAPAPASSGPRSRPPRR